MSQVQSVLRLEEAMPELLPDRPRYDHASELVEANADGMPPEIMALLWLYVDDLHRSHEISQGLPNPTGSWLHGIMHRREGDFENAKYWLRQAARHPALYRMGDFDPIAFVDKVREAPKSGELLDQQRQEWKTLMSWCLENVKK